MRPVSSYVALLRGVNVGGRNKLPMADLRRIFTDAGCASVRTYIQSGNVVFEAAQDLAERVPEIVTSAVREQFGFETAVIVRSSEELRLVADSNPFDTSGDPRFLHVAFLLDTPDAAAVAGLDPQRSPPDAFEVRGRHVYLHYPNGVAGSKLTNDYLSSQLQTVSTMRNWRTVLTLLDMAGAPVAGRRTICRTLTRAASVKSDRGFLGTSLAIHTRSCGRYDVAGDGVVRPWSHEKIRAYFARRSLAQIDMLIASEISKAYSTRALFSGLNLVVTAGDRIALIGPNGSGKTTLMDILAGDVLADTGSVSRQRNLSIGYLKQEPAAFTDKSVLQEVLDARSDELDLADRIAATHEALSSEPDPAKQAALLQSLGRLEETLEATGGGDREHEAKTILSGPWLQAARLRPPDA